MINRLQLRLLVFIILLCGAGVHLAGADLNRVQRLIPGLANSDIAERYAAQMELQDIAANASRPGAESSRAELAAFLADKAQSTSVERPARIWIIRQLEYVGGEESVESLVHILNSDDSELRESARRALEKNSADSASTGLRMALKEAGMDGGAWTIGLIHALGARRDANAVSLIVPLLRSPKLGAAAADALGHIANPEALRALNRAARTGNRAAANGLITAGKIALADGYPRRAATIFSRVTDGDHSPSIRAAALAGLLKTEPDNAARLTLTALRENDVRIQQAVVTAAARLSDNRIIPVVVDGFSTLGVSAKVHALRLFDESAEAPAIAAVGDSDPAVQIAALDTLARIGSETSVPVLIHAARSNSDPVAETAATALARVRGKGAAAAIETLASKGDSEARAIAIRALADRSRKSSLAALVRYAEDPDPAIRAAALDAVRRMGGDREFPALVRLYTRTESPDALAALKAVAVRSTDESAAVGALRGPLGNADPAVASGLFDVLTVLGGDTALKIVSDSALGRVSGHSDAAFRSLSRWQDYAAAPILLQAARRSDSSASEKILAVRGVVRLLKAADNEPVRERVDFALTALELAERPDEKRLVLSALATVPDARSAAQIKRLLRDSDLRSEAGLAALSLAPALFKVDKDSARDLLESLRSADVSEDLNKRADALLKKN